MSNSSWHAICLQEAFREDPIRAININQAESKANFAWVVMITRRKENIVLCSCILYTDRLVKDLNWSLPTLHHVFWFYPCMYKSSGLPRGVALKMKHINGILCSQFIRHRKRTLDTNAPLAHAIKENVTTARTGKVLLISEKLRFWGWTLKH